MPPLALYSSANIWAAHFTPSPVMAEGPVMAEENPTRIGGAPRGEPPAQPARDRDPDPSASDPCHRALLARPSAEDLQFLARLREPAHAGRRYLDRVLHLDLAPAVLVVRR